MLEKHCSSNEASMPLNGPHLIYLREQTVRTFPDPLETNPTERVQMVMKASDLRNVLVSKYPVQDVQHGR